MHPLGRRRTEVELTPVAEGTPVVMSVEALHDETWTQRLLDGRANELDNLVRVVDSRGQVTSRLISRSPPDPPGIPAPSTSCETHR